MELIRAPLAVMVPERIGLLKIENVKYVVIKSPEIKVLVSTDMKFVKQILRPQF